MRQKTVTPPSLDCNITILQRPDDGRDLLGDHKIFKILKILLIKEECRCRAAPISQRRRDAGRGLSQGRRAVGSRKRKMILRVESTSCD